MENQWKLPCFADCKPTILVNYIGKMIVMIQFTYVYTIVLYWESCSLPGKPSTQNTFFGVSFLDMKLKGVWNTMDSGIPMDCRPSFREQSSNILSTFRPWRKTRAGHWCFFVFSSRVCHWGNEECVYPMENDGYFGWIFRWRLPEMVIPIFIIPCSRDFPW